MNQSENIHELATALSKAQGEMRSAVKDAKNPFFRSMFASLGSCWDACRQCLTKNGLAVVQQVESSEGQDFLTTKLIHSSGQWMSSKLPLILKDKSMQGLGASISYARRYGLIAMVGIDADEDLDGEDTVTKEQEAARNKQAPKKPEMPPIDHFPEPPKHDPKISSEQVGIVLDLMKHADPECVTNMYKYLNKVGVHAEMDITQSMYGGIVSALERNIKAKENK